MCVCACVNGGARNDREAMLRTIYPSFLESLPDSPNEILEETAMGALTSSLHQLAKLSRYANQIFDELLVESKQSFEQLRQISERVDAVKTKVPVVTFSTVPGTSLSQNGECVVFVKGVRVGGGVRTK